MERQNPYLEDQRPRRRRELAQRKSGTPLLLRFLSWTGVILLCFVLGYLGMSWLVNNFLSRQSFLKPENVVENQAGLSALNEAERAENASRGKDVQKTDISLYYVRDDRIMETKRSFIAGVQEDGIRDAVNAILSMSSVPDAGKIEVLHVFRNADTAFLDLSPSFESALASMGQRQSLLLLTGLVRTLQENFSPVVQVRFLIGSKAPSEGGPVDLTVPWKMPSNS